MMAGMGYTKVARIPFTVKEESMIRQTSWAMNVVAWAAIIGGWILVVCLMGAMLFIPIVMAAGKSGGLTFLVVPLALIGFAFVYYTIQAGVSLRSAAADFLEMVSTDGADQALLETGLIHLRDYARTQVLLSCAGAIIGFLATVIAFAGFALAKR